MENLYNKASLVLTPQMVETGKVYSMKPEDRKGDFTFSRSTYATRVGPTGLVEKETGNLLLQSNQFDTTWAEAGSSGIVTSGFTGYDGSNDAWQLEHKGSQYTSLRQTLSSSGVQTYSLYAKAGTLNYVIVYAQSGVSPKAWFNLSNGTIGTQQGSTIDASIESVGNGWYRCSIVFNDTIAGVRIYPNDGDGTYGTTAGTIYIQDAQLEQGLVARDYIETTTTAIYGGITDNVPRLDYTDSSCPALLLEPQRTNVFPQSEYLLGGYYNITASTIITTNYGTSPEGLVNSSRLDSANANGGWYTSGMVVSSGETYTCSIFAKLVSGSESNVVRFGFSLNGDKLSRYDLSDGTIDYNHPDVTTSIQDYGNGWYRLIQTITTTSSGTLRQVFYSYNTAGDYEIYGQQVEEGSYATSYIPTYGSAVTRGGDRMYSGDIQANNIITSTSGTLFFELDNYDTNAVQIDVERDDLAYAIRPVFRETVLQVYQRVDNVQTDVRLVTGLAPGRRKCAISWNGTSLITSVNGTSYTDTIDGSIAAELNEIETANWNVTDSELNQLLVFPTQLTEDELNDLTAL